MAGTFGDLVDLKSRWLLGRAGSVAELAGAAASRLGVVDPRQVRITGCVHDLSRLGVSSRIWGKAGPLSASERDQARLHPYHTERILARVPELADIAGIAGQHHERCDGSGYYRGLTSPQLSIPSRVLAGRRGALDLVADPQRRISPRFSNSRVKTSAHPPCRPVERPAQ